ncbi:unnamed protein product, partial [Amoebophrya sp. A25]
SWSITDRSGSGDKKNSLDQQLIHASTTSTITDYIYELQLLRTHKRLASASDARILGRLRILGSLRSAPNLRVFVCPGTDPVWCTRSVPGPEKPLASASDARLSPSLYLLGSVFSLVGPLAWRARGTLRLQLCHLLVLLQSP